MGSMLQNLWAVMGFTLTVTLFSLSLFFIARMHRSSTCAPVSAWNYAVALGLIPTQLAQLGVGLLIFISCAGISYPLREEVMRVLGASSWIMSIFSACALYLYLGFRTLSLRCICSVYQQYIQGGLRLCLVAIILLCLAQSAVFSYAAAQTIKTPSKSLKWRYWVAAGAFADALCSIIACAACLQFLHHANKHFEESSGHSAGRMQRLVSRAAVRCILVFLSVFVLQVPRGILIICYPSSPALDFISPVLGQLYYMIYVLSIIRIIRSTPRDHNVDMDDGISPSPSSVALSSIHFVLPNDIPDSELMESMNPEDRADTATPGNSSVNLTLIRTPAISPSAS